MPAEVDSATPQTEEGSGQSISVTCTSSVTKDHQEEDDEEEEEPEERTSSVPSALAVSSVENEQTVQPSEVVDPALEENKRNSAAICIQAHFRGHLARKKYRVTVNVEEETTVIEETSTEDVSGSEAAPIAPKLKSPKQSNQDEDDRSIEELHTKSDEIKAVTEIPIEIVSQNSHTEGSTQSTDPSDTGVSSPVQQTSSEITDKPDGTHPLNPADLSSNRTDDPAHSQSVEQDQESSSTTHDTEQSGESTESVEQEVSKFITLMYDYNCNKLAYKTI
ncbi:unnamed protein product [Echinostoma caproni]|uniref:Uncharacterized protein n=1 Tax=Echinostoma caproni TaxID=27848 RepID=A0A3P8HCS4_9TREM|nr:unnamed protein product [Echinostoma caproni]